MLLNTLTELPGNSFTQRPKKERKKRLQGRMIILLAGKQFANIGSYLYLVKLVPKLRSYV